MPGGGGEGGRLFVGRGVGGAPRFWGAGGWGGGRGRGGGGGARVLTAHTRRAATRAAIVEVDSRDVHGVVVVGPTLPMARVASMAEFWLGKPVVALNTA